MRMDLSKVILVILTKLEQKWISHCDNTRKTIILSINGGVTTNIVAGAALIHLEDQICLEDQIRQHTGHHAEIVNFFDIVDETGIGGILAAGTGGDSTEKLDELLISSAISNGEDLGSFVRKPFSTGKSETLLHHPHYFARSKEAEIEEACKAHYQEFIWPFP